MKGATCPECGEQTWQKVPKLGGRKCTKCGVVGWLAAEPPAGGGGTGSECVCGQRTLHRVVPDGDGSWLRRCNSCGLVVGKLA